MVNPYNVSLKRSVSPHWSLSQKKRKSEAGDIDFKFKERSPTAGNPNPREPLTNGIERIVYEEVGPQPWSQDFSAWHLKMVVEVTEKLAREGKRVIGHPLGIVFPDGITLHWAVDSSIRKSHEPLSPGCQLTASKSSDKKLLPNSQLSNAFRERGTSYADAIVISDSDDERHPPLYSYSESSSTNNVTISSGEQSLSPGSSASSLNTTIEGGSSGTLTMPTTSDGGEPSIIGNSPSEGINLGTLLLNDCDSSRANDDIYNEVDNASPSHQTSRSRTPTEVTLPSAEVVLSPVNKDRSNSKTRLGMLARVFDSDYEESSEIESHHEPSSDDERLRTPVLARAVATPLRELTSGGDEDVNANGSDSSTNLHDSDEEARGWSHPLSHRLRVNDREKDVRNPYRIRSGVERQIRRHRSGSGEDNELEAQDSQTFSRSNDTSRGSEDSVMTQRFRHNGADFNGHRSTTLPKAANARARRILVHDNIKLPLVTISMRADVNFLDRTKFYRISRWSIPHEGELRHVEDASFIDDIAVITYSHGPCQVSIIKVLEDRKALMIDLDRQPHRPRKSNATTPRTGASCLAPMKDSLNYRFATGGYDKRVYIWALPSETSTPIITEVPLVHNSFVQALAYRSMDHCLLSAAGVNLYSINVQKVHRPKVERLSNVIKHIQIHPHEPNLAIVESNHLDNQIQIFDKRQGGFDRVPCVQFGYRTRNNKPDPPHTRGTVQHHRYARGYGDGTVRMWDFRNIRHVSVNAEWRPSADAMVHTTFCDSNLICFGGHVVHFLDYTK